MQGPPSEPAALFRFRLPTDTCNVLSSGMSEVIVSGNRYFLGMLITGAVIYFERTSETKDGATVPQ